MSINSERVVGCGVFGDFGKFVQWRNHLVPTVIAFVGVFLAVPMAQAQYAFTNVADTTTAAPSGTFDNFEAPSISDGVAAFKGQYGSAFGIFTGSGGALTTIAKQGDSAPSSLGTFTHFDVPSISGGTVAFDAATSEVEAVFAANGGTLTTISKSGDAAPTGTFDGDFTGVANSAGTVAFSELYGPSDDGGVFTGSGGALTTIVTTTASAPTGTFTSVGHPSISGATVAFFGYFGDSNAEGIFTGSGGPSTSIVKTGDSAPTGTFSNFGNPAISGGTVAFWGAFNSGAGGGIFTGSGAALTTIVLGGQAAPIGTFDPQLFSDPSINGNTVAFDGYYNNDEDQGIFTSTGGTLANIIDTGDSLFGSTVTSLELGNAALDGNGNIAFQYELSNGVSGVAIASVPEPASISLLSISGLALLARRRRR
jgi:hypothetical protein